VGIQAGIVTIIPGKLQGIEAHRFQVDRFDVVGNRAGLDAFLPRPFIDTVRAGATLAQFHHGVDRFMAVAPGDSERSGIDLFDIFWGGTVGF